MTRLLYRCLIALHPPAFRRQFGPEMELNFDESGRDLRLFGDILTSLLRQWVLRSRIWVFAVALVGAFIPFALGFGALRLARPWFFFTATSKESLVMVMALIAVTAVAGTLLLSIAWFRFSRRRLRA